MSEIIDIKLPKLGESIVSATVVTWLKKVGDHVHLDDPLVEVSTDKISSEIPSPIAGILTEIITLENEEIEVDGILAKIKVAKEANVKSEALKSSTLAQSPPSPVATKQGARAEIFSPAVLRLAQTEAVSLEELRQIGGTGKEGRVSKKDLEEFITNRGRTPCPLEKKAPPVATLKKQEERVALTGMRKAIADNMVRSFYEAPHASLVQEADVTDIMELISQEKERFLETHGVKLTITSFLVYALSRTLMGFPMINASLEEETIVMKRYVNVGLAVNISGGLVVPVIKHCHERNLVSIAKAVAEISKNARAGKLSPDDVADGTITMSNFGMTGALIGVPIIRYPEVAIIGAGTIQKRVVAKEDDSIAVRKMLYLTLTFDHRVIDGIYGCEFLKSFKEHLESFPLDI